MTTANNTKTILVVDDEEHIRLLLRRILENAGYSVVTANNGREALEKLTDSIDLVLLDIKMPEMDGFQTLNLMRDRSDVPVMMVTGVGEVASASDALVFGADDYIRKPFKTGELLARIGAKLRRRG